jgi:hypothetical protein
MAKLVGTYKFVVGAVDVGKNKNGNDMLKLGLTLTDERINDQDMPLQSTPTVPWFGSLKRTTGPKGKSAAQVTVETLKSVFEYEGGVADLHKLMFGQGYCVCEDHNDGNFTRVSRIYGLNAKAHSNGAALVEFSADVVSDLDAIFKSVQAR